jgi:predicted dehydrogenase
MKPDDNSKVGVIGVGKMGNHHARIYNEIPEVTLVGVNDIDRERADTVATKYGTRAMDRDELLKSVDAVTVAVPTEVHHETVLECIDHGVDALVEKPLVDDLQKGYDLMDRARRAGVTIQPGHIERFNPVVRVISDIVPDLDVVNIQIERLGPPIDRAISNNVVMDLMVHDIDIILSLLDVGIESVLALAYSDSHVSSQFQFDDGSIALLTASRLTQQKVRRMFVTTVECWIEVDFIDQTVDIHRRSVPEYVEDSGEILYRQESVVERPMIDNGEPLKNELTAFVDAVRDGSEPVVTCEEALRVLEVSKQVEESAFDSRLVETPTK